VGHVGALGERAGRGHRAAHRGRREDEEAGRIGRSADGRIVRQVAGLVHPVAIGVEADARLVGDRRSGGSGVDGGGDGDGHRAAGGNHAVPVGGVAGGRGRAGGGRGRDQSQAGGQGVGELRAGVVLLVIGRAIAERHRVGDVLADAEGAGDRLGGGHRGGREDRGGGARRVVGVVRVAGAGRRGGLVGQRAGGVWRRDVDRQGRR